MKSLIAVLAVLLFATLAQAEDSLMVPAKAVPTVYKARATWDSVQTNLRSLRADSVKIAGTIAQMQGGKFVPVLLPDRVLFQKAGDEKGAKAVLAQYQGLLKAYCQQIAQENGREDGIIKVVLEVAGWKDRNLAIRCLEAK